MTSAVHHYRLREGGFSLLEVLVAFAILALSLGVLLQIFSKAMAITAAGAGFDRAAAVAEAQLERVGFEIPLEPGVYDDDPFDGMAATVRIEPYPLPADSGLQPTWDPLLVVVEVLWQDGGARVRRFRLASLRAGVPQ